MGELIQRAVELPWGFIMSTLFIRFVGVFIVLAILLVAMRLLGAIVSRIVSRQEARGAQKHGEETPATGLAEVSEREAGEEELVAAIGAAIAVAMESEQKSAAPHAHTGITAGSWTMAGRVALMNRRLQAGSQRRR